MKLIFKSGNVFKHEMLGWSWNFYFTMKFDWTTLNEVGGKRWINRWCSSFLFIFFRPFNVAGFNKIAFILLFIYLQIMKFIDEAKKLKRNSKCWTMIGHSFAHSLRYKINDRYHELFSPAYSLFSFRLPFSFWYIIFQCQIVRWKWMRISFGSVTMTLQSHQLRIYNVIKRYTETR